MKRILFLLSSLLLVGSAHAQFGLRAGGNTTSFTKGEGEGSAATTTRRKLGYQVGLYYQVPLTKCLSLVPEVQFSRERFYVTKTLNFFENSLHGVYNQSLSYLNVPFLLRANLGIFYLEAGPQLSLLVGGRAEGSETSVVTYQGPRTLPIDAVATQAYHRFDAGPCVGVGLKLPAGLGLGLRAYWGLTRLTPDEDFSAIGQTYNSFEHRHTLQASLTYQLPRRFSL